MPHHDNFLRILLKRLHLCWSLCATLNNRVDLVLQNSPLVKCLAENLFVLLVKEVDD